MEPITPLQAVFNRVYTHAVYVLKGRRAAFPNGGSCSLRAVQPGGLVLACFVGACISDDVYGPQLDHCGVVTAENENHEALKAVRASGFETPPDVLDFLDRAQRLHDSGRMVNHADSGDFVPVGRTYLALTPGRRLYLWKRTLTRYAKRNGLIVPAAPVAQP
jgi:hypothetical protein